MFFLGFFTAAYLFVVLFALIMTYDEQKRTGGRGIGLKILSFLACLFWPITLVALVLVARTA